MTKPLRLGVVTDLHLAPAGSPSRRFINEYPFDRSTTMLDDALEWFAEHDVDAIAVLGDLVMFEDEASLTAGMSRLASLDAPVLIVPGNHDGVDWPAAIERHLPNQEPPAWPTVTRVIDVRVEQEPERWWTGGAQVPDEGPVVVLSHFPVIDVGNYLVEAGFPYAGDATWDDSRARFLERQDPIIVLSGHVHVRYEVTEGSVLQLGCAALIEPPHGAAILDIREDQEAIEIIIEHTEMAAHDVAIVPIISPATSTWRFQNGTWHRQ